MDVKNLFVVALLVTASCCAVDSVVVCSYKKSLFKYSCHLIRQTINTVDDMIEITGFHLEGYGDQNVTELTAENSMVKIFPNLLLQKFENLEEIDLNSVGLETLQPLEDCANIENIYLTSNQIRNISARTFAECKRLIFLSLSFNKINSIDKDAFVSLNNLVFLHLNNNNITELDRSVFVPLVNLRSLDLSYNSIKDVPFDLFWPLTQLKDIKLAFNQISRINNATFSFNEELIDLSLNDNFLVLSDSYAPTMFSKLKKLRMLSLRGNFMHMIPNFVGLDSIEILDAARNQLGSPNQNPIGSLEHLKKLTLSDNTIRLEVNMLMFSEKLELLFLRNNSIYYISKGALKHLINLQVLDLSQNFLTELVAHDFTGLIALISLDLSDNRINSIDLLMFDNLPNRQEINLQDNVCARGNIDTTNKIKEELFERLKDCVGSASAVMLSVFALILALIVSLI